MEIKQFRYSTDNFAYLVYGDRTALAVDPGAADDMIDFAREKGTDIRFVANTHSHHDHTSGNTRMLDLTGARFLDHQTLIRQKRIDIGPESVQVYPTPGHTADCVVFHVNGSLITGDTLFNGTIGNCFSGDMAAFFTSIQFLLSFDPDTHIYAGHDYVRESMAYARIIDPDNPDIDTYLSRIDPARVRSTIGEERRVNPYLRFNSPRLIETMQRQGLKTDTAFDRFCAAYELG